jgi:two-component system, OmpR family, phosphate regulon response regulator PhoB
MLGEHSSEPSYQSASIADIDGMAAPPPTILVIDDEPLVLDTLALQIESVGFKVLQADNAESARALALSEKLDLILSDVNMPGLRGPDLVRELKAAGVACPVLFISGDPSFEVVDTSLQVPGANFLPKPFTHAELVDAIFETLGQR